jgi:hypothetical protein
LAYWKFIAVMIAATLGVLGAFTAVEIAHNAVYWHWQGLWPTTVLASAVYVVSIYTFRWAGRAATNRGCEATLVALTLLLAVEGISQLQEEHGYEPKPREPSPIEYRATTAALMCIPLLISVTTIVRRRRRARGAR